MSETVTLYRPVGQNELALIEPDGMRAFPSRLPEQPSHHLEYWIPAEQLDDFNRHIVGPIEIIARFD